MIEEYIDSLIMTDRLYVELCNEMDDLSKSMKGIPKEFYDTQVFYY